jgi:uncharacterized protein (TIGR04255 family)
MERKYAKPPIVEAVCEFRLTRDSEWDPTIPGLIYEILRKDFPRKQQKVVQEINISQTNEGLRREVRTTERAWSLAEDRKSFVQTGPYLLAVNCLRPYLGWMTFKPMIEQAFRALASTVGVNGLERIGLLYINQIEIPGPSVKLEEYFGFRPSLGEQLPQDTAGFSVTCVLQFAEGRDCCKVGLATAAPEKPGTVAFLLDLDYFVAKPRAVSTDGALEWLEAAHERVLGLFEGCVTDHLREIFEEVK